MTITVAMRTEISQLYVSLFGRAPDGEGLGFWVNSYSKGNTLASIAQSMYDTAPARAYYPLFATPSEIVTTFYTNVLGRAPDAEGLAFWVKEYGASATQGAFFSKLISNVVNYSGTDAAGVTSKSLFANKVAVAQYYGEQNGTVAGAASALNGVTAVAASVDTAKAAIVNTVVSGQTFTLTTGVDTLTGTTGNDSFVGVIDTGSGSLTSVDTINGSGGTDTLSVRITDIATAATSSPSLTSIEVITIDNDDVTGEVTFNTGSVAGITNINSSGSTAASLTNISNVAATAVVGLTSTHGTFAVDFAATVFATTADNISVTVNGAGSTATGGAPAVLVLDGRVTGGTTALATDNTLETITITSSTAASRVNLVGGSAVKTLNISGDVNLTLSDTANTFGAVTTVAASTMTGALDIDLSNSTANVAVTTGSGSDRIAVGAVSTGLTTDDSYNLGAGTDIVAVTDTEFTTADITLIKAKLTTAEVLEFAATISSASYSFSDVSVISSFRFTGTNTGVAGATGANTATAGGAGVLAIALTGIESGDSITFAANTTGGAGGDNTAASGGAAGNGAAAITLAPLVDGGADSITITLTGGRAITGGAGGLLGAAAASSSGTTGAGGNAITANSLEIVNIVSSGTSANTIAGGSGGATGASGMTIGAAGSSILVNTNGTVNVTGTQDINIGTVGGTNSSVNAANFTGKLTVKGEAGNNTIVGGSAVDTINGGAGIDTLTGNGGADVFRFQLGANTTDSESNFMSINTAGTAGTTLLNTDSITDYVKGSDIISILLTTGATGIHTGSAATLTTADILTNGAASTGTAAISSAGIATFVVADDLLGERIFATEAAINAGGTAAAEQLAVFEHSTNTYVFVSDGTDGMTDGDVLIKLTGVTGITTITFSSGNMILS
jgi:hypothetical protein